MLRRRYGISLSRAETVEEDVNPNAYMVNLADCMLVMLLGTVVALMAYYNVDLTQASQPDDEIVGIQVNLDEDRDGLIDSSYQKRGSVYYDETTGEYYLVNEGGV